MTNIVVPHGLQPSLAANPGQKPALPRGLQPSAISTAELTPVGVTQSSIPTAGNPTAVASPVAVNGTSSHWMRADACPAIPINFSSWTPTDQSGASLTLTINTADFFHFGNVVVVLFSITYPSTSNSAMALVSLPVSPNAGFNCSYFCSTDTGLTAEVSLSSATNPDMGFKNYASGANLANSSFSGVTIKSMLIYST